MSSEVEICNRALQLIGQGATIANLDEDSIEARNCKLRFSVTRDRVLRAAHWGFARRFATMALLKSAPGTSEFVGTPASTWITSYPPPPWLYSYTYPTDCINARYVIPQHSGFSGIPIFPGNAGLALTSPSSFAPWTRATDVDSNGNPINVILTNAPKAILCYTARIVDTDRWDAMFEEAVEHAIAGLISFSIKGQRAESNDLIIRANNIIINARVQNANEDYTTTNYQPAFTTARDDNYGPLFEAF